MKTKKTILNYDDQYSLVESFIIHNTNEHNIPLNYKLTSHGWALEISKWAGVEVSPDVVIDVCKEYKIESREICRGVFVFAMEVSFVNNKK